MELAGGVERGAKKDQNAFASGYGKRSGGIGGSAGRQLGERQSAGRKKNRFGR
jgi:hypothetical protein